MADQKAQEFEGKSPAEFGEQDAEARYKKHGPAIRKDAASEDLPVGDSEAPPENSGVRQPSTGPQPINGAQTDTGKSASG